MAELREYRGVDACAFEHVEWPGRLYEVPHMLQAGPEPELMEPKKHMAKEKFSEGPSTLGREFRGGELMRHVCPVTDNPGCWHRWHAFAGHFHQQGLLVRPRRPAPSSIDSPEPDSEENLAFYLEVRESTRSYDTSE